MKVLVTGQDGAVVDAWLPATTSRGGGQRRQREPVEAVFDPIDDRGINRVSEPLGRFDEGDVSGLIGRSRSSVSRPKSCWTTRSAMTMSPMHSSGSSPPATPVKTMVRQPNRSASSVAVRPVLTLPMPAAANTTRCASSWPLSKRICATCWRFASTRTPRRYASSCGIAQMTPTVTAIRSVATQSPIAGHRRLAALLRRARL